MKNNIITCLTNEILKQAKNYLEKDGVIVLPTDTNYNLICGAHSEKGIARIFNIKGRSEQNPLSLFFSNPTDWEQYGFSRNMSAVSKIIKHFWPGPLNIVLYKTKEVPAYLSPQNTTIALGCISNPIWQKVVSYYGCPIVLSSANKSGKAKNILVTADIALEHVGKDVDLFFIDSASSVTTTQSSTIIDFTGDTFSILREGDIKKEDIQSIVDA